MKEATHILIVLFKNRIKAHEVPLFRGAVIHAMQANADVLFHNHIEDSYRYAYPLIQYKRIHGQAALVCIQAGTGAVGSFFERAPFNFTLAGRNVAMEIQGVKARKIVVQPWDSEFSYNLKQWLALNAENYQKYLALETLPQQIALLEKVLVGNLLSFSKGVGIDVQRVITCCIRFVSTPYPVPYKGVKLMAFDVQFTSNFSIPDYVGLGKNASMGCGVVVRKKEKNHGQ
jgi:hypothetical protein